MTGNKLRVGVVGLGAFGRHHVRHYALNDRVDLVAVCDADADTVARNVEAYGCAGVADPSGLVGKVDAVSVAVPAVLHQAVAGPLLDAGIHVLVEKPLAPEPAAARDLARRAEEAGVVLQTGHIERFSPAMAFVASLVRDPRRITCVRRAPWTGRSTDVDVVLDMMIHDIDHVLRLAGAPPVSVAASARAVRGDHADEAEAWLTFPGGANVTLSASRVADETERTMSINEPGRTVLVDFGVPAVVVGDHRTGEPTMVDLPANDNLGDQIAAFVASVLDGAPVAVDAAAAVAAVDLAGRIRAVAAEEQPLVSELT